MAEPSTQTTDTCLGDDDVSAYVAGSIGATERDRVRGHLDTCDSCRSVVLHATQMHATPQTNHTLQHVEGLAPTVPAIGESDHGTAPPMPTDEVLAGRYQLKRVIGTGGMGTVYEALDLSLHRLVALKVMRLAANQPDERADAVNRLIREARAMAVLSHKNVVAVYDVGPHGDQAFVAMQLVDGTTFRIWRTSANRSVRDILRVLRDAGSGLAAAHAAGLIHRDFKPDNVLVSASGTARVTDFGLARRSDVVAPPADQARTSAPRVVDIDDSMTVTRSGAIVGTPAYMAPEQAQGDQWDARVDQFSFCVTAWEALVGQRPFPGGTWSEIYANVINGQIESTPTGCRVPRSVLRALRRGLAANPKDRHESMTPLLAAIDSAIARPTRIRNVAFGVAALGLAIGGTFAVAEQRASTSSAAPVNDPPALARAPDPTPKPTPEVTKPEPTPTPAIVASGSAKPELVKQPPAKRDTPIKPVKPPKPAIVKPPLDEKPAPAPDPQLVAARAARRAIDSEWTKRELLASDLPAAYRAAIVDADAALSRDDTIATLAALDRARAAIANVTIDESFIHKKLNRINAGLKKVPKDQLDELQKLLGTVVAFVNARDFAGANRKLNEIAIRLARTP